MRQKFRKYTLAVSVLSALSGIVFYPEIVFALGSSIQSSTDDITGNYFKVSNVNAYRIFSAKHTGAGTVSQNTIVVDIDLNWSLSGVPHIIGGRSERGLAHENTVLISNTDIYDVFGGASQTGGSAIGNQVLIGLDVKSSLWDDSLYSLVAGGVVNSGSMGSVAQGNKIIINATNQDGSQDHYIKFAQGGVVRSGIGSAIDNTVILNRGHVYKIFGAECVGGDATGNKLFIHGGLIATSDKTGDGFAYGGKGSESATNNAVILSDGNVIGTIYGGYGDEANNNQIVISGGTVVGSIFAGYGESVADSNRIEIKGTPNLTKASLFGSNLLGSKGNTLDIKTSNVVVQQIGHFENLSFYIDEPIQSNNAVLKIVSEDSARGYSSRNNQTDISSSSISVYLADQAVPVESGQEIVLLENAQGLISDGFGGSIIYNNPEGLLDYGLNFNVTPTTLGIRVSEIKTKPETQSFLSANLSRLALVIQGSDILTGQGMAASREASQTGRHLFVALQTGSNHYNDRSYIDLEGESLLIGESWSVDAFGSQVTLVGFVESGWGDYEAENALTSFDTVRGQGETHYQGAGLLAYWDQYPSADKGFYVEASVRLGRADLSYQMIDPAMNYDYDVSGAYHAAHVGLGFRYSINDENNLDLYTKFYYSHQDSDGFVIGQNSVKMNSITSKRWRAGLSYRHRGFTPEGCVFDWQTSLAYEYEFDGKAQGSIDSFNIIDSELQGSTGIGEVSITFLPSADSDMRLRASIQGYAGTREGFIGQIQWTQMF